MITPELEKLILNGNAEYYTYSIGGSGLATIPINPNAEFIVVTDFIWNPFHDAALDTEATTRTIHTLRLYNGKKRNIWNFRDTYIPNGGFFNGPTVVNCFYTSDKPIQVDIWNMGKFKVLNYANVPLSTNEEPRPNGYGNQQAVLSIPTNNGALINTIGTFRNPGETPLGSRVRNEFFDEIADFPGPPAETTRLQNPQSLGHFGYPLVTFGIVEVSRIPDNNLR